MEQRAAKIVCQRIGCNATFTEDNNPDGCCTYHESGPLFHDGMKEWSCCKKRSHDFSLFLEIPGCKTGKHTTEKPVVEKQCVPKRNPSSVNRDSAPAPTTAGLPKQTCSRCQQGFFCSDHGSQAKAPNVGSVKKSRKVDINEPQTCKNKGCGQTFKERDNHEDACSYHPGPAVFHDRMRGWECCNVHVKEFDEFLGIPPCTRGWHSAEGVL